MCRQGVSAAVWALAMLAVGPANAETVTFARHLALSPNGDAIAFSWAGDIWTASTEGGQAQRLTADPAYDSHPVWSPDGQQIAFASRRHGAANVMVMDRNGGALRRLTFSDRDTYPNDWSPGAERLWFHSSREGQVVWDAMMYSVAATGGQPTKALPCFGEDAAISPDGRYVTFTRGGYRWWRRGYRGSMDFDVYIYDRERDSYALLTDYDGDDRSPCWDAAGGGVYFLSSRGGSVNVWWQAPQGGAARQITFMQTDDVRDLAVSRDGRTLALTHWDQLYVMSLPNGDARQIEIRAGADSALRQVEYRVFSNDADEAEPSPDGQEVALVVRGEIYVIKTKEDQLTRRVTRSPFRDRDATWSPDGKALFFISDRSGVEQIYRATSAEGPAKALSDSLRFKIEQVTASDHPKFQPQVSPDGKQIAFLRLRGDMIIRDLASGEERVLLESWNQPQFEWSPDSAWLAYSREDVEFNADIWVLPADGGAAPVNLSRHPDYDEHPQWSADGRMLAFSSHRHGFDTDVYVVFLAPELEQMSTVERAAYFEKRTKLVEKFKPLKQVVASGDIYLDGQPKPESVAAEEVAAEGREREDSLVDDAKKELKTLGKRAADEMRGGLRGMLNYLLEEPQPEKAADKHDAEADADEHEDEEETEYLWELDTAWQRIRRVTNLPGDQSAFALAPAGSLLAFVSAHEGEAKLYTIKWDGEDRKHVVSDGVNALRWGRDGKRLFYLKSGVPNSCSASGGDTKPHKFRAKLAIDFAAEARQKFDDAARALGRGYYKIEGLDWPALTAKYRELALRTKTVIEFNEVLNMLLGELNGSHLGVYRGERSNPRPRERRLSGRRSRTDAGRPRTPRRLGHAALTGRSHGESADGQRRDSRGEWRTRRC